MPYPKEPDATARAQPERRRWQRETTDRRARFELRAASQRAHFGRVTDISLSGLRIETRQPVPIGTALDIELMPRAEGVANEPILVRGHVVRSERLDDGQTALGVTLHVGPVPGQRTPTPDPDALVKRVSEQIRRLGDQAPSPFAMAEFHRSERLRPKEEKQQRRRGRRGMGLLVLLALGFPVGLGLVAGLLLRAPETRGSHARFVPVDAPAITGEAATGRVEVAGVPAGVPGNSPVFGTVTPYHATSGDANPGRQEHAAMIPVTSEGTPFPAALEALRALDEDAARGALAGGPAASERYAPMLRALPPVWQRVLDESAPGAPRDPRTWPEALSLDQADGGTAADPLPLRLVVERSTYTLSVLRGAETVARYPVGLGRDGATPLGSFTIANKLRNPTWYNRGNPVPPGDPANPLGASWMGLGSNGQATTYGFHPTGRPDAIGANTSAGCIHMRPEDAATLFALCEVGTPVEIRP